MEYNVAAGVNRFQARYTHGPGIDEPLLMERDLSGNLTIEGGERFYYHTDGLGSVTELSNSTGGLAQSYVYDSFGNIVRQQGALANPYTYTGREIDPESGLYFYRARYYDPKVGRFLSEDPLGFVDGVNLHTYVGNSPINWRDPWGLEMCSFEDQNLLKDFWKELTDIEDYKRAGEAWLEEGFWKDPFYSLGGRVFGPFSPKGLPKWLQRPRQYFRLDSPHHGKGWHFDGDILKWFKSTK